METRPTAADRGFVSLVTLLETIWVMEGRYGADAVQVADTVVDLLDTASIEVQDASAVRTALQRYSLGGVDLHDGLIVELAAGRHAVIVTFDAKAARKIGMQLLR